jgi:membrane-bound lytic murein transglycosylase MltF
MNAKKTKTGPKGRQQKPNVDAWIEKEDEHKVKALQTASREFDDNDQFSVHTLEAIYGQESSFGTTRGKRGVSGASGDFQMEKPTAKRYGLTVTEKNDQRFDVDSASIATAKLIKENDNMFSKKTNLGQGLSTTPIADETQRKPFVLASINAGEGRIAKAQQLAAKAGKDPADWDKVKEYLKQAGASDDKVKEITGYVSSIQEYEREFEKKSPASEKFKDKTSPKVPHSSENGHWITTPAGSHIFIEETP